MREHKILDVLKFLVEEWDTKYIHVLFWQMSDKDNKVKNMVNFNASNKNLIKMGADPIQAFLVVTN